MKQIRIILALLMLVAAGAYATRVNFGWNTATLGAFYTTTDDAGVMTLYVNSLVVSNSATLPAGSLSLSSLGATAPGYAIVGNASSVAVAVAISGDISLSTSGVTAVGAKVLTGAELALEPGYIVIGSASSGGVANAMSGDVTIATNGVTVVGTKVLTGGELLLAPAYIVVGNASSQGVAVALSGDVGISTSGVSTVVGVTTNFQIIQAAVTNTLCFTNGILKAVTTP
jgi:hypothetical protein